MIATIYARKSIEQGPEVLCPQCRTTGGTEDERRGGR